LSFRFGNPAAISLSELRPLALRPTLSHGLPLSEKTDGNNYRILVWAGQAGFIGELLDAFISTVCTTPLIGRI
jgi:hypothetical protein